MSNFARHLVWSRGRAVVHPDTYVVVGDGGSVGWNWIGEGERGEEKGKEGEGGG